MKIGDIVTGYDFEKEFFGISSLEAEPKVQHLFRRRTKFPKSIKIVKEIQPILGWDPQNPTTEIGRIFYKTICSSLDKHSVDFGFYNALGTKLDREYNTDCFCSLKKGNKEVIIKIDLVTSKDKFSRADYLISVEDVVNDNIYGIARSISKDLQAKLYSKMNRRRRIKTESYNNKYCFETSP